MLKFRKERLRKELLRKEDARSSSQRSDAFPPKKQSVTALEDFEAIKALAEGQGYHDRELLHPFEENLRPLNTNDTRQVLKPTPARIVQQPSRLCPACQYCFHHADQHPPRRNHYRFLASLHVAAQAGCRLCLLLCSMLEIVPKHEEPDEEVKMRYETTYGEIIF